MRVLLASKMRMMWKFRRITRTRTCIATHCEHRALSFTNPRWPTGWLPGGDRSEGQSTASTPHPPLRFNPLQFPTTTLLSAHSCLPQNSSLIAVFASIAHTRPLNLFPFTVGRELVSFSLPRHHHHLHPPSVTLRLTASSSQTLQRSTSAGLTSATHRIPDDFLASH